MGRLDGKVALVTGASRGIGAEIARRFGAEGAKVAVTARTVEPDQSQFEGTIVQTVKDIEAAGGTAIAVAADLSDPEDRDRLLGEVEGALGTVDVLVNNAAVTFFTPIEQFAWKHWDLMFEVQVRAPVDLARRVVPAMKEKGAGWILNISSGAARHPQGPPFMGGGGGTVYGMCKAALERFTTGFAAEIHGSGIAVNVMSPAGLVVTPGVKHHRLHERVPEERYEPEAVMAAAALELCTGDPEKLTGRITYSRPLLEELGVEVPA